MCLRTLTAKAGDCFPSPLVKERDLVKIPVSLGISPCLCGAGGRRICASLSRLGVVVVLVLVLVMVEYGGIYRTGNSSWIARGDGMVVEY